MTHKKVVGELVISELSKEREWMREEGEFSTFCMCRLMLSCLRNGIKDLHIFTFLDRHSADPSVGLFLPFLPPSLSCFSVFVQFHTTVIDCQRNCLKLEFRFILFLLSTNIPNSLSFYPLFQLYEGFLKERYSQTLQLKYVLIFLPTKTAVIWRSEKFSHCFLDILHTLKFVNWNKIP